MEFKNLKNVATYYEQNIFPSFLEWYKKYYGDMSERKKYIKDWQANLPSKILARIVDTFWSRIYDNQFRFYVSPNDEKDVKKAKAVHNLLTWAIQVSGLKKKFLASTKDALIVWEGYGRVKYTIKKEKVEYINPKKWKKEFYLQDLEYPDYIYISPFNIFVDPTAQSFENARYVIYRRLMTESQIQNEYKVLTGKEIKWLDKLLGEGNEDADYLITNDYLIQKNNALYNSSVSNYIDDETLTFDKNKYFEVIEYWEKNKLVVFVNGYKIYEWINPLPIKTIPFVQIVYNQEPWMPRGTGLYHQLKHVDEVGTAAINAFVDDMKLKTTPVYKRRIWLNAVRGINNAIEIEPWMEIPVEDPNDLVVMELGRLNYDIQNIYQFLLNEAMMIAGVNDIVMWWPLMKVDRSATSSAGRIESFKARALNFYDSINQALGRIAELWLGMIVAYNKWEKFKYKMFDEDEKKTIFNEIKLEDIEGQFDIIFDTQQLKSAMRDIALQKKMNFLQVAASFAIDPVTQQPLVDLKKLIQEIGYDLDLPDIIIKEEQKPQQQEQQMQEQILQQALMQAEQQPQQPQEQPQVGEQGNAATEEAQMAKELLEQALNSNR